jgi:hypothetical protein
LTVDPDTLVWWGDQSRTVRRELWTGVPLTNALTDLREFFDDIEHVWAKSPSFDCAIVAAAFDAADLAGPPWEYWQTRDVRAINALPVDVMVEDDGTDHHALSDARQQAKRVAAVLQEVDSDE